MIRKTSTLWGGVVVCLVAFMAVAILSDQIFEHVPHSEDEVAYIFQAKVFAQNRLTVPTPPNDRAFWTPFVVDYQGQRFGKYPPGWPALLSLGVRLNAPWLVNAWLASLTLALLIPLGRCYYRSTTGLLAAGLALVTPGFLFLSSSLLSHPASLFWVTLALITLFYATTGPTAYGLLRTTGPRHQAIYAMLTGLFLGATFITRPFAALGIGLAVGIFVLILIVRGELTWTVLLWLALGGLFTTALLPLYWWAISGDPTFNPYLLVWPYDRVGFGPDIGPYGYDLRAALLINTRLKLTALATGLFGWPGWTNLLFLPIPFLARRANRWDWFLLGTLVSMITVHVFYWSFGGVDGGFPRYYYDALPALLLLTARGLQISIQYLSHQPLLPLSPKPTTQPPNHPTNQLTNHPTNQPSNPLPWLPISLLILFTTYNFIWTFPPLLATQKGKYNITPTPLQVVAQANLPEPALIIVKNVEIWSDFAAPFAANSPSLDGPVVYAIDWGSNFNRRLQAQFKERTCWELEGQVLRPCP